MREKLRRALNEEKAGIRSEDSDVSLLVETEVGDAADFVVPENVQLPTSSKKKKKGKSAATEVDAKLEADDVETEQKSVPVEVEPKPESTAVANSSKAQQPVVIGGALKQSGDGQPVQLVKRKRTKKKVSINFAQHMQLCCIGTQLTMSSCSQRYQRLFVRSTNLQKHTIVIPRLIAQTRNTTP